MGKTNRLKQGIQCICALFFVVFFCFQVWLLILLLSSPEKPPAPVNHNDLPLQVISVSDQLLSETLLISNQTIPLISGQSTPLSHLSGRIENASQLISIESQSDTDGTWSVFIPQELAEGTYQIHVQSDQDTTSARFAIKEESEDTIHEDRAPITRITQLATFVYPGETWSFHAQGPDLPANTWGLSLINEKGISVFSDTREYLPSTSLSITLPHSLPSGKYTLTLSASHEDLIMVSSRPLSILNSSTLISWQLLFSTPLSTSLLIAFFVATGFVTIVLFWRSWSTCLHLRPRKRLSTSTQSRG